MRSLRMLADGVGRRGFLKPLTSTPCSSSSLRPKQPLNTSFEMLSTRPPFSVTALMVPPLLLFGHLRAVCPGFPQSKQGRSSNGTRGLVHSGVACLPPQLPHRASERSPYGGVQRALGPFFLGFLCCHCPDRVLP